ncbi:peroxiredoxin [Candidatus Persebacteraceae bacterium Df01]|jgi:peroxiredoxin|uniref:Peroxiredoxin n=1 Tax=Candidatus Doriopsillibacter californiensis TaxID=2970740 RepID=A0ABT7QLF5_9GAMM|nr:peroxiredoxin [Candidatus Persebacteraceae bacterium Df01]
MNKQVLPDNLPVPEDDGACAHLEGMCFPLLSFETTEGSIVLAKLPKTTVVYIYPRSSADSVDPEGWDAIPGARGCSPQGCAFRDHQLELSTLGASVFGLATQDVSYLRSEVARLHLPFPLISDSQLQLKEALNIPILEMKVNGASFYKRITLILRERHIVKVFYPVFPPDKNAENVIEWLKGNPL